jgi:hypothetical protein
MFRLRGLSRGGRLLLALAAGGALFAIATAVQASIPDASGVIHGCYNNSLTHGNPTGALRVIDTAKANGTCAGWELPLNWNQRGVTGAKGVRGPTGLRGAKGATGPTGSTGSSIVARLRGGPAIFPIDDALHPFSLTPNSWTQGAMEVDQFVGTFNLTTPLVLDDHGHSCVVEVLVELLNQNGVRVVGGGGAGNFIAADGKTHVLPMAGGPLFEPGVNVVHTLTGLVGGHMQNNGFGPCPTPIDSVSLDSVAVDVIGIR